MNKSRDKIVISGAALATGLGLTRQQTWQAVREGQCALRPLTAIESPLPAGADGGQALDLPADFSPDLPREALYLKWTIAEALRDAKVGLQSPYPASRVSCLLGTTLHGMRAAGRFLRTEDFAELTRFLAGSTMQLAVSDLPVGGLVTTTCSACSSSLASIALAVTLLEDRRADMVIAGGYDTLGEYVYGGFNSLRLIARGPVRPFTRGREGMKIAEGYGIVILERASDAARRGIKPLATIDGWGESADAHHLTQPDPAGDGAARAMIQALDRANLKTGEIGLVAAHATGTPDNDAGEYAALSRVFGDRLPAVPVVAFKSHLGHTLGGAGAVELILSAMALRDQVTPACVNVRAEDVEFPKLNLQTGRARSQAMTHTLNLSLGFGGANACVILGQPPVESPAVHVLPRDAGSQRDVCITGIGVILPGIVGIEALRERVKTRAPHSLTEYAGAIADEQLAGLLNARRVRRMSDYVKLTLAATTLACRSAGLADASQLRPGCSAILGTTHGSSNFCESYYRLIVSEGLAAANPILFAEGVPNAGAAQLSLMLALKGACQTIIGTRSAGLEALAMAATRIRNGDCEQMLVSAGEEHCDVVREANLRCHLAAGADDSQPSLLMGAGAVTFLLESGASAADRGARVLARVEASASAYAEPARVPQSVARVIEELGRPTNVLTSACGTWIDRAEAIGLRRSESVRHSASIYGHIAETFSVTPLAAIAATIVDRKLAGGGTSEGALDSFAALCTDFTGSVTGVRIGGFDSPRCVDNARVRSMS